MKDLDIYFQPCGRETGGASNSLNSSIIRHEEGDFPDLKPGIAIFYTPEFRRGDEALQGTSNDSFRDHLYDLFPTYTWKMPIFDLGTIVPGEKVEDTYFAVSTVCAELVKNDIIPIVIGGSQDLTFAMYKGYEQLEQLINICSIDSRLDIGKPDEAFSSSNYVSQMLLQRPCYLFNFANVGCQAPFADKDEFELFEKLYFDVCRLGEFNMDFKKAEPHIRNTDILSIDLNSIRSSDFPSGNNKNPNGFYADQVCQIAKYSGLSDKLTSFGLFNTNPNQDSSTANQLLAQIVWYFIDGVSQRKGDFPIGTKKDYMRFSVHLDDFSEEELVFLKSHKTERWWMEVPYPPQNGQKYLRHHMVPCDKDDYERAMKNEIPDLWWKTYQKLG
ncbi:MAG: formiminoglutamase [Psychromonas sp.]|jgi:formiminoglutamase